MEIQGLTLGQLIELYDRSTPDGQELIRENIRVVWIENSSGIFLGNKNKQLLIAIVVLSLFFNFIFN